MKNAKTYLIVAAFLLAALFFFLLGKNEPAQSPAEAEIAQTGGSKRDEIMSSSTRAPRSSNQSTRSYRKPTIQDIWGDIIGPTGDCNIRQEDGRLIFSVPGSDIPHDMNPGAETIGGYDAPRVLQPVTGDFSISIRVDGKFQPGDESTQIGLTSYNGAGLLVIADDDNFIRLERAAVKRANEELISYVTFEMRVEGATESWASVGDFPDVEDIGPTWMKLERQGSLMYASVSYDGSQWHEAEAPKSLDHPAWTRDTVKAGILAVSTSRKLFEPKFSEVQR